MYVCCQILSLYLCMYVVKFFLCMYVFKFYLYRREAADKEKLNPKSGPNSTTNGQETEENIKPE